jgi:hypothetical protein
MSDVDDRLARALDDAVPQPPRELDPESIRTAPPARRRRSLGPSLAAAAVVVIAVGVGLVSHHRSTPDSAPGGSPRDVTVRAVARLLAGAPTVPGATELDHPPVKVLDGPMQRPGFSNVVRRARLWTAPGTMATALSYYRAHVPAGLSLSGTSGGSARADGNPVRRGLFFDATGRRWQRSKAYTELELLVEVAPFRGEVAIRVDAEAVWLPPRTPAEHIPGDVTSVDVVVDRTGHAPTVRRTFDAAHARTLAAIVDRQAVVPPGVMMHCAVDFGWIDSLTFHGPSGDVLVDAQPGGCGDMNVGPRSEHNPTLYGGTVVDLALLRTLGLPHNYGR